VNAVAPGGTNTNIQGSFSSTFPPDADMKQLHKIMSPLGIAEPEEMAAAFAYIASDEARYMTGAIVSIDGGITA
jgi:NAD(P)-dependent dehydrogenase (short-subunit alcohol dehydrogenase family)